MGSIASFFKTILDAIMNLTAEQIALLSLIVSLVIYLLGKRYDIKLKKYDAKKEHYAKFMEMFSEMLRHAKDKGGKWTEDKKIQEHFYDTGASLAIYGSRKMYRLYVLSRSLENPLIQRSKYYDREIIIYIYARIFRLMRKEIGLNGIDTVSSNEILAFFINDIGHNPIQEKKQHLMEYRIRMIRLEMFYINIIRFVHVSAIYYKLIRPILGFFRLFFKYLIVIPTGKILLSIFGEKLKKTIPVESEKEQLINKVPIPAARSSTKPPFR